MDTMTYASVATLPKRIAEEVHISSGRIVAPSSAGSVDD